MGEVVTLERGKELRRQFRENKKKVVFTNGTFDILHRGHVDYLNKARAFGDVLIVGLNSDRSVRRLKGEQRPVMTEDDRAYLLTNLRSVDYVIIFDEDTPFTIIQTLLPDVLVKGADWALHEIVGKDVVEEYGGTVHTIELTPGRSSSAFIQKIVNHTGTTEKS
jgi:rfaE bifunctional protein nucleotidyltransferase chain/domain